LSFGRAVQDPHAGLVRMAAVSTWFVVVFGGVLNTSLHHEHGLFAVLVFGLWVGLRHPPPPVQRAPGAGLRHLLPIALILMLSLGTIWAYAEQIRRAQAEASERALAAQLERERAAEQRQRAAERRQALISDLTKLVPDGATRFALLAARGLNVDKPFEEAPLVIQQWRGQTTLVKQGILLLLDFPRMSAAQCRELLENAPQWVGVVRVATTFEAIDEMQLPVAKETIAKSCRSGGVPVRYVIDLRRWVELGAS
jgi:hypothetical protein